MADLIISTDDVNEMTLTGTGANIEIDVNPASGGGGTLNHAQLINLDYTSSGHTGFASKDDLNGYALKNGDMSEPFGAFNLYVSNGVFAANVINAGNDVTVGSAEDQVSLRAKADKTTFITTPVTYSSYTLSLVDINNKELRLTTTLTSGFVIYIYTNGAYTNGYTSGLSFKTGDTAPSMDYIDSGIVQWIGTDCKIESNKSIFTPQPNKTYDIIFYFNGEAFVGLVNGYTMATSN